MVELRGRNLNPYRLFRDNSEMILEHKQSGFTVEISPISTLLIFCLTDTDSLDPDFRQLIQRWRMAVTRSGDNVTLSDSFLRLLSVKVRCPLGHAFQNHPKQLNAVAEASLFHISYGYGIALVPMQSWERSIHVLERRKKEEVQFPLRTYNHELVA